MLVATCEGYEPRRIKLEASYYVLGRSPQISDSIGDKSSSANIRLVRLTLPQGLSHPSLSRDHCRLEKNDKGEWIVSDAGSINGVFVDNIRVARGASATFRVGNVLKLTRNTKPSFEYRFDPEDENAQSASATDVKSGQRAQVLASGSANSEQTEALLQEVTSILECPLCTRLVSNAACLPCGHIFCATCIKGSVCSSCQTEASKPQVGFASRCTPIDRLVRLLSAKSSASGMNASDDDDTTKSALAKVFIKLREAGEEADDEDKLKEATKRVKLQQEENKMIGKCPYCAEPEHEEGMRCPDRSTPTDDEESGLEDYA